MFSLFTCKSGGGGCHGSHPKTEPVQLWSRWPRDQDETVELRRPEHGTCLSGRYYFFLHRGCDFIRHRPAKLYASSGLWILIPVVDAIERVRDCVIGIPLWERVVSTDGFGAWARKHGTDPTLSLSNREKWFMLPYLSLRSGVITDLQIAVKDFSEYKTSIISFNHLPLLCI